MIVLVVAFVVAVVSVVVIFVIVPVVVASIVSADQNFGSFPEARLEVGGNNIFFHSVFIFRCDYASL